MLARPPCSVSWSASQIGRDDVGGTRSDRRRVSMAGRRADQVVAGIGAPLGEQRLDVPGEFDRRRVPVSLGTWIPARAALHPPVPRRELRQVAIGQIEHGAPQLEREPRSERRSPDQGPRRGRRASVRRSARRARRSGSPGPTDRESRRPDPGRNPPCPGEPALRSRLVVGVVGEHRRDVVVPGDPEPVADPVPVARMVLAKDRQQPVRRGRASRRRSAPEVRAGCWTRPRVRAGTPRRCGSRQPEAVRRRARRTCDRSSIGQVESQPELTDRTESDRGERRRRRDPSASGRSRCGRCGTPR